MQLIIDENCSQWGASKLWFPLYEAQIAIELVIFLRPWFMLIIL